MMNIKEKFGCDFCDGTGWITIDENDNGECGRCNGTGFADAKILAYVKEQTLESIVAGCRIVEAMKENAPVMSITNNDVSLYWMDNSQWCVNDSNENCLHAGGDLNTNLDALLGEEKEG